MKKTPSEFDHSSVAWWKKGEPVPFLFLSLAFDMIKEEKGRNAMSDIGCNVLRTVMHTTPGDLLPVVYLFSNRIAPPYQGLEMGVGKAAVIKTLAEACGRTEKDVKEHYKVGLFLCCSSICFYLVYTIVITIKQVCENGISM